MARSQETYSKKENEKKRIKKKQDKQEKREERKANAVKGKSLDDMMAYIDEDGNLSSTPPDPRRKKIVKSEDMQIRPPRQTATDPADLIRTGTVTHFNDSKGYGFIKDSQTKESNSFNIIALEGPLKETNKVKTKSNKKKKA